MHYVNQCSWPRIYKRRTEELLAKNINQPLSKVTAKRMKNLRFSSKFSFHFYLLCKLVHLEIIRGLRCDSSVNRVCELEGSSSTG